MKLSIAFIAHVDICYISFSDVFAEGEGDHMIQLHIQHHGGYGEDSRYDRGGVEGHEDGRVN